MTDIDRYGATPGTSGVRPPRRRPPRTLVGSVVATVAPLVALFVIATAPELVAGLVLGAIGGATLAVLSGRSRRGEAVDVCLPRVDVWLSV